MDIIIKDSTLFGFLLAGLTGWLLPVILWIVWKKKTSARAFPLIVGVVAYIFISILRVLPRAVILNDDVKQSPWLYYLLSALISGILEEAGRYLVFRHAIANYDRWADSVSYGIGHGGWEMLMTDGVNGFSFDAFCLGTLYNSKGLEAFAGSEEEAVSILQSISEMTFFDSMTVVYDCFSAMAFHVAMSVLVFTAVHHADDKKFLLLAMALHTTADLTPTLYFCGFSGAWEYIFVDFLYTAGVCYFVYRVYCYFRTDG